MSQGSGLAGNGATFCFPTNRGLTCNLLMAGFEFGGDEEKSWTKIMSSNVTVMGVVA
jgi:hypothetical protein